MLLGTVRMARSRQPRQMRATRPVARRSSCAVSFSHVLQKRSMTGKPFGLAGCGAGGMGTNLNSITP